MHVLVLGSGVVGTTLAYYLARKGAKVTVVDRQEGPALETSFGNAGQVSFGYTTPWAAPGVPLKAVKWLMQEHAPLAIRPTSSLFQYKWMFKMMMNCTKSRYHLNKSRMVRVSEYSRECIDKLREETGIQYEERTLGTTQLLRTDKQMEAIKGDMEVLAEYGVPFEVLDRDGIIAAEPALEKTAHKLVGGLKLPNDQTGDCHIFTNRLADIAKEMGVEFKFNANIEKLVVENGEIKGVMVDGELMEADNYALCLGSYSTEMLRPVGIDVPVYPLKGYSLTIPITNPEMVPKSTILDETYKIAITRFDDRIRVGGMAEIMGFDLSLDPRRRKTLEFVTKDLYPEGGAIEKAEFWTGLRPATPDGTPIIGPTKYKNLFLNIGHGTLGWTMSTGSGNYLSDIILGNKPEIDTEGLDVSRYN